MNAATHPLTKGVIEYRPVVPVRRRDFLIKAVLIAVAFVLADVAFALLPGWRHRAGWHLFPSVFSFLGIAIGIVALFTTRTSGITLNTEARTLDVFSLRLFGGPRQRRISLDGAVAELLRKPSGRVRVWVFTITCGGRRLFGEVENAARFDLAALQDLQRRIVAIA